MACGQRSRTGEREEEEVDGGDAVRARGSRGDRLGSGSDVVWDGGATARQTAMGSQLLLRIGWLGREYAG